MALKWLRDQFKHLKIVLWAVVIVFVLLVFVDWGSGRSSGQAGSASFAVRIGDREVSEQDFLRNLQSNERRFRDLYGAQWEQVRQQLDLPAQTIQQLVDRDLLLQEAERVGLKVSEEELQQEILSYPAFQREDGGFVGPELYERILRANRMSPQTFEVQLRDDLLANKLRSTIERGLYVSDADVEERFRQTRETADVDVIQLRYENFLEQISIPDDEIDAYYSENAEDFRRPEQRSIRYLVVETTKLRRLLPVEDTDVQAYFEEHRSEFTEGEKARARHVLFRVEAGASPEVKAETEMRANGVAKMARSGADFAELASKHSDDPGSKDRGGDLDWFGRGRMVKEFEDAVFGGKPGDIVGPVESQFGYHVIKIEGYQPERERPLEEVEEQVRFRLLEGRAAAEAEARAKTLADRLLTESPSTDEEWQLIADGDEAMTLNVSPPFSRDEVIPGIGDDRELVDEAFAAEEGAVAGPRLIPRGWVVWQLSEIQPEGVPSLDDVREEVVQHVSRIKAMEAALVKGAELVEAWRSGSEGTELAEDAGSSVVEARGHRRSTAFGSGVGVARDLDEAVFTSSAGQIVGPVSFDDRAVLLAKVVDLQLVDPVQYETERESVRAQLMAEKAGQLLQSVLNERRRDTVVTVNNELLERFSS